MKTFAKVALGTIILGAIATPIAIAIKKSLKLNLDPKDLIMTEEDYAKLKEEKAKNCLCNENCDCSCSCHDNDVDALEFEVAEVPVQKIKYVFNGTEFFDKDGNPVSDEVVIKALNESSLIHFDIKDAIDKYFNGDATAFESVFANEMFGIDDKYNPAEHLRKIFKGKESPDNEEKA